MPDIKLFQFANPEAIWLLLIIPVLIGIFIIIKIRKKNALERFGDKNLLNRLMPEASPGKGLAKFLILSFALALLILMIARPQFGSKLKEVTRKSAEVIIALDVSNSMMATDIKPSRLDKAKLAISQLMNKIQGDNLGLIVFAGQAYTQIPITSDFSAAELFLESVNTSIVPVQGTNITAAINLGMKSFSPSNEKGKALIIITDGENHEEEAISQAKTAAEKGIRVSTVGMGGLRAVPIPDGRGYFKKKKNGEPVLTKLNETLLKQIAKAGGGIYTPANNIQSGLSKIYTEISGMDRNEMKADFAEYDDRFMLLASLALIFLLVEFFILERKNRWVRKFDIFKE